MRVLGNRSLNQWSRIYPPHCEQSFRWYHYGDRKRGEECVYNTHLSKTILLLSAHCVFWCTLTDVASEINFQSLKIFVGRRYAFIACDSIITDIYANLP